MADLQLLPPAIRDPRGLVLLSLADQACQFPLDQVGLYDLDHTPVPALAFLAEQFGVMGTKGWILARNDSERRQLIKEAIALCRRKGTPWAVKQALAAVGWPGMVLEERLEAHWALFRVSQAIPDKEVTAADYAFVREVVEAWKPARCVLDAIRFRLEAEQDTLPDGLYYDGGADYDGVYFHEGDIYDALAEIRLGDQSFPLPDGAVDRTVAGKVVVRFTLSADDFNGLTFTTITLFTGAGLEVARIVRHSLEKSPDLVLDTTWTLNYAGAGS